MWVENVRKSHKNILKTKNVHKNIVVENITT